MTATESLRRMLDERGVEYFKHEDGEPLRKLEKADEPATSWHMGGAGVCAVPREGSDLFDLWIDNCTPEQAVATLGSELPYDELLRCLENDWHISASWDGLRKFWCIELTEEGVKLRNSAQVTLTAEQVRDVIEVAKAELLESCKYLGDYEQRTNDVLKAFGKMEQEIAATVGAGTCHDAGKPAVFKCSECGWYSPVFTFGKEMPQFCPSCGRKVVDE